MTNQNNRVLITGGAGFIGRNLTIKLIKNEFQVTILDNLNPQIHKSPNTVQNRMESIGVKFIKGDVQNKNDIQKALKGAQYIVHLAAETGVGQSMYMIKQYVDTNIGGTANLIDAIKEQNDKVKKVILSSSRAVYGEGAYLCKECGVVYPKGRTRTQLRKKVWKLNCPKCNKKIRPVATKESSPLNPKSIYGITKQTQEQLIRNSCDAYQLPHLILRFQNVYGPGQSLHNPYTGVLTTFSTKIKNKKDIEIYEDGEESRDFVYIDDVVNYIYLGIKNTELKSGVYNIGTGVNTSIEKIAKILIKNFASKVNLKIIGKARLGDIRHSFADLSKAINSFNYSPRINIEEGISKYVNWVNEQGEITDHTKKAKTELIKKDLFLGK